MSTGASEMELPVFLIVLMAAVLHASWNAFVKMNGDRFLFMAVMMAASAVVAFASAIFLPLPAPESWPYIATSVLLHTGYPLFLLMAYKFGDLSHVYPLARGSAPLMVALVSVFVIGEVLSSQAMIAVMIMAFGIMSLSLTRGAQNLWNPWAVFFALGTGIFIAAYTLTDGIGARLAGNAHSYTAWMMGLEGIPFIAYVLLTRKSQALPQIGRVWKTATLMGLMSLAAYWSVIWAMTVAPIALVAAVRETSIIFALLFGVFFLKERLSLIKFAATFMTLFGVVLLKINRN
ncbi:EamA family transporter [Sneathiella sp. CAU 1612]|uniref:EamA family transporter n=1 Tax=Sneathiella sedimenti TaxID=2816034 RepID=A0ABS3F6N0_9PROT|nr:DMT family transporter [Sneathiella sedimenti]MBO0333612.1 EamA family transporter [Sneathiella sedimenti]